MKKRIFQSGLKKSEKMAPATRHFAKDEDGAVFTLFVIIGLFMMFATTGMGVDIMKFERERASMQATLDRAVLAAANLDQVEIPAKVVAEEYIQKSGLSDINYEIQVFEGIGSRRVVATSDKIVTTNFMKWVGIDTLTAAVTSTAEESVGSVEISLVLDMSGSMGRASATPGKTKMEVLQEAAKNFVTTMYEKENPDKISISIIPYATQVNAGADILDKFTNVTAEHAYSHCLNFRGSDFQTAVLDPDASFQRTAHFDRYRTNGTQWEAPRFLTCATRAGSEITAHTNDIDKLHEQIDDLTAQGNTSIDIGVKWGMALLDPEFRGIIGQLSREGVSPGAIETIVPQTFGDRPKNYEDDVEKILIVFTDGENTSQYRLDDDLRDGNSDVWFNTEYTVDGEQVGEYSVRVSDPDESPWFYWTRQDTFRNHPYGYQEPGEANRLTYPELFNRTSLRWNAENNYDWQNNNINNWYWNAYNSVGSSTKNTRTSNICAEAKKKGVVVYGIAFEAPAVGVTTIEDCASSAGKVYAVNSDGSLGSTNLSLDQVFESIAASIKQLKLTQ
ncbi:Flp pilus assembly protein TadG [Ruegeria denitrificans]|uniref:Flp pilus assembly protein TadG n=1 Tax=Ruegeria denitrificans TaxID=1715692 RepID=A0A0P1I5I9_9RHOB|nr:TadE/TadG family type IV pilus assembly protein [Ruegeria denitrificans]CUJ91258.1 Flp pilus assembly protein TadG [Ruegeria denitrificans]